MGLISSRCLLAVVGVCPQYLPHDNEPTLQHAAQPSPPTHATCPWDISHINSADGRFVACMSVWGCRGRTGRSHFLNRSIGHGSLSARTCVLKKAGSGILQKGVRLNGKKKFRHPQLSHPFLDPRSFSTGMSFCLNPQSKIAAVPGLFP